MKLLVFDFVTHVGGAQRATTDLAGRLKKEGVDVLYVDGYGARGDHGEWVRSLGIDYRVLHPGKTVTNVGYKKNPLMRGLRAALALPGILKVRSRLRNLLKENSPDVALVYSYKALRVLASAAAGLPVKVAYWGLGEALPKSILDGGLDRKVDLYFCLSEVIKANSVAIGFEAKKIRVLPAVIDVKKIEERSLLPLNAPLPDTQKPVRMLVTNTLLPAKGQDCAIRAVKRLADMGVDAVLYLAGDSGVPGYMEKLISLSEELSVRERVHFLGWRNDVPQLLRASTVLVMPSHTEGMSLSLAEGLAMKVPVVSTPVGFIKDELLQNGRAGALFPVNDDEALANHVAALARDRELHDRYVAAGYEVVCGYSAERQIESFKSGISEIA